MLQSHEEKVLNTLINAVADRQELLANNLTNVNTPGATRMDMDFSSILKDLDDQHYTGLDMNKVIDKSIYEDHGTRPSYEKELAEMAENHLKYVLLTRINGHIYQHMEEATQSGRAA
jgi:flagellar basal body rod protein FlgB